MHNFCNIFHLVKAWQRHLVDMYMSKQSSELQIAPRWWAELDVEGLVLISKLQVRYVRPNKRGFTASEVHKCHSKGWINGRVQQCKIFVNPSAVGNNKAKSTYIWSN